MSASRGFDEFFGNLYHLNAEEEPELPDYPKDPKFLAMLGPRGVLHCKATDTVSTLPDDPRFGPIGKQTHRGQVLVLVARVILAELAGGIAEGLEHFGDGRVLRLEAQRGAGHAYLGEAGPERVLAGDEGGASGSTALLAIVVGEADAFVADPVDVGGTVAHLAATVEADIPPADIIAPDKLRYWAFQ
jgi:hypothetical protein